MSTQYPYNGLQSPGITLAMRPGVGYTSPYTGRGAARLARLHGVQEVPGSNPGAPTGLLFTCEQRVFLFYIHLVAVRVSLW